MQNHTTAVSMERPDWCLKRNIQMSHKLLRAAQSMIKLYQNLAHDPTHTLVKQGRESVLIWVCMAPSGMG